MPRILEITRFLEFWALDFVWFHVARCILAFVWWIVLPWNNFDGIGTDLYWFGLFCADCDGVQWLARFICSFRLCLSFLSGSTQFQWLLVGLKFGSANLHPSSLMFLMLMRRHCYFGLAYMYTHEVLEVGVMGELAWSGETTAFRKFLETDPDHRTLWGCT